MSCVFSNVKFVNNKMVYFKDPGELTCAEIYHICPFDPKQIGLRTGDHPETKDWLEIEVVNEAIPSNVTYVKESMSYLFSSYWPINFGHWLIDDMFSVFSNVGDFGLEFSEIQLYIKTGCKMLFRYSPKAYNTCIKFNVEFGALLFDNPIVFLNDDPYGDAMAASTNTHIRGQYQNEGLMFQNVVVGQSQNSLSYGSWRRANEWRDFTSRLISNTGIHKNITAVKQKLCVGVMQKTGRRMVENMREMIEMLKKDGYDVVSIDPSEYSLNEVISKINNEIDILFTPPGAISFNMAFLQPEKVAIVIDYWDSNVNTSMPLEGYWWEGLGAFRIHTYDLDYTEVVFPDAYFDPSKLTERMKTDIGFTPTQQIEISDMTKDKTYKLVRNFANTKLDPIRFLKAIKQAERYIK